MNGNSGKFAAWLFETKAIRVCPQDEPFWYTSGTIGPYYINTHFLYGGEKKANKLLELIDKEKDNILECPVKVLEATLANYKNDAIYKGVVDEMILFVKNNLPVKEIDYISGGERRDWFFSLIAAHMLDKPHIAIYKDMKTVVSYKTDAETADNLQGGKVLHIADLITEGSSYERAWIPAIRNINGHFMWSLVVVDRKQGGSELLESQGIKPYSMVDISGGFFENVLSMGIINKEQHKLIIEYMENPKESMRRFLLDNPNFLEKSLASDPKTAERARLCIEKDIYDLKDRKTE